MQNNIIIVVFILIIIAFYTNELYADSWHIEVVDNSERVGGGNSIAIDSKGYPHISYYDWISDYPEKDFKYAYWDGEKWNIEVFYSLESYLLMETSIALDSNDHPYIAYYDYLSIYLKCAHFDGQKWNIEYVGSGSFIGAPSIVIDDNDNPHIAYTDYMHTYLKYAYWTGIKWNIETVGQDKYVSGSVSLALDSKGLPHIAYSDYELHYIRYAYFDGNNWNTEVIETNSSMYSGYAIVIDSYDNPYMLYGSCGSDFALTCAKWNGKEWTKDIVDKNADFVSNRGIVLNSDGNPCITYFNWDTHYLKYAKWDGNKWNIEVVDDKSNVDFSSIALDSHNNPHIAYSDYSPNYDLKYAWYGTYPGIDLTSFSVKANNNAITLNWSVSTDEDISGFNLYRRIATPTSVSPVRELAPKGMPGGIAQSPLQTITIGEGTYPLIDLDTQWTKINTSLITGTNPYSYTDRTVEPETTYEYKLEAVVSDRNEMLGTTSATSGNSTPSPFEITRIYPTPADDRISIDIVIPEQTDIDISIYDITGRKVATVVSGLYNPGEYTMLSDVSGLINGVYIVRMTADKFSASKNFIVAR